jgi:hypothetical protein
MKKKFFAIIAALTIIVSPVSSQASIFGEENATLIQILFQAIQQLAQLRAILANGQDTLGLLQSINAGINDSLILLKTVAPDLDPGIYQKLGTIQDVLGKVGDIYGAAVPSGEYTVQNDTDHEVAEAIAIHNQIFDYSKDLDEIGSQINKYSHVVSPGGAQKLTAQAMGVMLHAMSASNRIQSKALKLQAQALEVQNHKDKVVTELTMQTSKELEKEMANSKVDFALPRF